MQLSDVVSNSGLSWYAQAGLVVAVIGFAVLLAYLFLLRRSNESWERLARIPLSEQDESGEER